MMLVPVYVAPSTIEGLGLFAAEPISEGDLIYRYESQFDKVFLRDRLHELPKQSRDFVRRYATAHPRDPNKLVLDSDEARFMNHSKTPNTDFSVPLVGIALQDIEAGTELTANYKQFKRRSS